MKEKIISLVNSCEEECINEFKKIDKVAFENTSKVIDAFHKYEISENDFSSTTGYGYSDIGREKIEKIFSEVLSTEDSIVRNQFVSGSHA